MNFVLDSQPYNIFRRKCDFVDLFHPFFEPPPTYGLSNNNMNISYVVPKTLDYIMIHDKQQKVSLKSFKVEELKTANGNSFSDHEAITTTLHIDL